MCWTINHNYAPSLEFFRTELVCTRQVLFEKHKPRRKLKVIWTPELAEELLMYDALKEEHEKKLQEIIAIEISKEIIAKFFTLSLEYANRRIQ